MLLAFGEGWEVGGRVAVTLNPAFAFTLVLLTAPPPPLPPPAPPLPLPAAFVVAVGGSSVTCSLDIEVVRSHSAAATADFCCRTDCFFSLGPRDFENGDGTRTRLAGDLRAVVSVVVVEAPVVVVTAVAFLVVVATAVSVLSAPSSSVLTPFGPLFCRCNVNGVRGGGVAGLAGVERGRWRGGAESFAA